MDSERMTEEAEAILKAAKEEIATYLNVAAVNIQNAFLHEFQQVSDLLKEAEEIAR